MLITVNRPQRETDDSTPASTEVWNPAALYSCPRLCPVNKFPWCAQGETWYYCAQNTKRVVL